MTRRNGLLLGLIGLIVGLLVWQVESPVGLQVPRRGREVSDGGSSNYRGLKSERHYLVEVATLPGEEGGEKGKGRQLVWVEVGDDPVSLEDGYPKGVIQFHIRPVDPLLLTTPTSTPDPGWQKLTRQRIPGNLVMGVEDWWGHPTLPTTSKEERIGPTLTLIYEVPDPNPLSSAPLTWLRTYYFDWTCPSGDMEDPPNEVTSPFPYRELRLPGVGTITSLTMVNGTLTYSREGDRYLFWTGEVPTPICDDDRRTVGHLGVQNLMRGPPASRHFPSRSQYAPRTLQAHSFHRLKSHNQEDHFTVLMANFKWEETEHVAEVKAWSFQGTPSPLDTRSEEDHQLTNVTSPHWKRKTLLRLEIPNYLDSPRDLVESLTQTALLSSLSHHLLHHATLPTPRFASLNGEAVVIFPYRSIATLVRYCTTKGTDSDPESTHLVRALSFESEVQESIDPRSALYPSSPRLPRSQFNIINPQPYPTQPRRRRRSPTGGDRIFQRLRATPDGHLLSLQSGDRSLLLFQNPPPSARTPDPCLVPYVDPHHLTPHYLLQSRDLPPAPILASSLHSHRAIDHLVLLHPGGTLTTWSLSPTPSPLPLDRFLMVSAMAVVILLFVVNEVYLPPT